jgi:chromosome segregation ATPase
VYLTGSRFNVLAKRTLLLEEICISQLIIIVDTQNTDGLNGKRPFEERVFSRFDAVDSAIRYLDSRLQGLGVRADDTNSRLQKLEVRADDTNSRLQNLEVRAYDTKPIWEQAIKEIVETRRELSKRLDRIDAIALETRADLRDAEDRLDKIDLNSPNNQS